MAIDLKHFPFAKIREQQAYFKEAYNNSNKKFIIGNLPTGAGKSPLALAISESEGKGYILTLNKGLQDQYTEDFESKTPLKSVKGRRSYPCVRNLTEHDETTDNTCENGRCKLQGQHPCASGVCPYRTALDVANESTTFLTNYSYFFAKVMQGTMQKRDVIVFDESHLLEDELVKLATVELSYASLKRIYNVERDVDSEILAIAKVFPQELYSNEFATWLRSMVLILKKMDELITEELSCPTDETDELKLKSSEKELSRLCKNVELFLTKKDKEWVKEIDLEKEQFTARPLDVSWIFSEYVEGLADKFVFLSATIFDKEIFCRQLGLDINNTEYINVASNFPPEKSPICLTSTCKTDYKSLQDPTTIKAIVKEISLILNKHPNEKGIIHSGNMKLSKAIRDGLSKELKSRVLVRFGDTTNVDILEKHRKSSTPTVLISSSMNEGVDLLGDLSSFQVIVKAPFLSLGDERIKTLSKIGGNWYQLKMYEKFVQACGRSTRSIDDSSITYVLDNKMKYWLTSFLKRGWISNEFSKRISYGDILLKELEDA